MALIYSSTNNFWIKPNALNIGLNHLENPNLIEASLLAGAVIMAYKEGIIPFNAAHNYRTWQLNASRTFLEKNGKCYVYARLDRNESSNLAQIIYSYEQRDMLGTTVNEDGTTDNVTDPAHYYILLGVLSAAIDDDGNSVPRVWEEGLYSGSLATDQYIQEEASGELKKMFRLNTVTNLIDVLLGISSATINVLTVAKSFVLGGKTVTGVADAAHTATPSDDTLATSSYVDANSLSSQSNDTAKGHITFEKGVKIEGDINFDDKDITGVDVATDVPDGGITDADDKSIPTTAAMVKHVQEYGDANYISKVKDDTAEGVITFDKGLKVGNYTPGVTDGSGGAMEDRDGNIHLTTDYLNVRRKARFNEVEIQTTHHIGGAQISSAASCKIDFVQTVFDANGNPSAYRCYFRKTDKDGNIIGNPWKVGDQAYCNTFNLEQSADGKTGNHFLWMLVLYVADKGADNIIADDGQTYNGTDYAYINLSATRCAEGSDAPLGGDEIVLLGHQKQSAESTGEYEYRQTAIYQSSANPDGGKPYYRQYVGIKSFSLDGRLEQQFMPGNNIFRGKVVVTGEGWKGLQNEKGEDLGDTLEAVKEIGGDLSYSATNMLRNTGFYGEGKSADINANTIMNVDTETLSPSLEHWTAVNAQSIAFEKSPSGYAVEFNGVDASISQATESVFSKETYIVSFQGTEGTEYTISYGGVETTVTAESRRTKVKIVAIENPSNTFSISCKISGSKVYGLLLERGTVASNNWIRSVYDVNPEIYRLQNLQYLANAIRNGSTTVKGGLILSNIIQLGKFVDGVLKQVTSGVSGVYNSSADVALWSGGTFEHAGKTVAKLLNNPFYNPTEEELAEMAKFVVTHGGTAILNEAIVRGTVYATNGIFNGEVNASSGIFKNVVINGAYNRLVQTVNDDNLDSFCKITNSSSDSEYYPYLLKWGDVIHIDTTTIKKLVLPNSIPVLHDSGDIIYENVFGYKIDQGNQVPMTMDDVRSLVGRRIVIHGDNIEGNGITIQTGIYKDVSPDLRQDTDFITPTLDRGEWRIDGIYPKLANGGCVILECILAERKFTINGEVKSAEMIAWAAQNIRVSASWQAGADFSFYIWFDDRRTNFRGKFGMTWADYIQQDATQAWTIDSNGYVVWSIEDTNQYIYLSVEDAENENKVKGSDSIYPNHEYYAYS